MANLTLDPRTNQPYTSPLAQHCHERYLRLAAERLARWRALPLAERAATYARNGRDAIIDPEADIDRPGEEEWK